MEIRDYSVGRTTVRYLINENKNVSMQLIPQELLKAVKSPWETPNSDFNARMRYMHTWSMGHVAQLHLAGHAGSRSSGMTMKYGESTLSLKFHNQRIEESGEGITKIVTELTADEGYGIIHTLTHFEGETAFFCETEFVNRSDRVFTVEMLSSFSLDNLSPFQCDDAPDKYALHRFRGGWSLEGKHSCENIEELTLEKSWYGEFYPSEKFGSAGGYPVGRFFPLASVEDREHGVFWTAQLEHNAAWEMELTRNKDTLSFSGGLGDDDFSQWRKAVGPGESFKAPRAYISAVRGDIDEACQSVVRLQNYACESYGEKGLPIAFNEFCSTWGKPTEEKMLRYAEILKDKGVKYFVVDGGWSMHNSQYGLGDWEVDTGNFPDMGRFCNKIRSMGMVPGIWFEFEVTSSGAKVSGSEYDHMHLKRDGEVIKITDGRRFWDMRRSDVRELLRGKVTEFLKRYGFGYIKIDYNANLGSGCDGAESLGEGLRQQEAETARFFAELKREIPELIIENCASGGHRSEPLMMGLSAVTSSSDAHEAVEIPIIAANMHNLMLPRQSLIWATVRPDDSEKRLRYTMAATFLGRMCLSGDIDMLNAVQWNVIDCATIFYKSAAELIRNGATRFYSHMGINYRYPMGTQVVVRSNENEILVVAHSFENPSDMITIELPEGFKPIHEFYNQYIVLEGNRLIVHKMDEFDACALILHK